ncbi:hypothetical protein D1872_303770 [compost metagenome]
MVNSMLLTTITSPSLPISIRNCFRDRPMASIMLISLFLARKLLKLELIRLNTLMTINIEMNPYAATSISRLDSLYS